MDTLPLQPGSGDGDAESTIRNLGREFMRDWLADRSARIEPYLTQVTPQRREEALNVLLRLEIWLRASNVEGLELIEFLDRFPAHKALVKRAFRTDVDESITAATDTVEPNTSGLDVAGRYDVIPEEFGRYRVMQVLGTGGFGVVCLARDPKLERLVALKFARSSKFATAEEMQNLVREAQTAAGLEHAGIVAIYDVLQEGEFVGIVQQLIDGRDLREELATALPSPQRAAELMIAICSAVAFAHARGFVHRDLKPANILIDKAGNPYISDFGLAIHESFQRQRRGDQSGTPGYMSPELVRGESHRIDGRSDIWSLGVILYLMLTGSKPFSGETREDLFDEIKHREPKPPRQLRPEIPAELERICLRCLAKPVGDRYATATDVADDLRCWLQETTGSRTVSDVGADRPVPVVPRGLRSFDAGDAEFFLQLIPGPRGRNGFPESVRFWKDRFEGTGQNREPICLLYGPSGCGKSSFVRAGLVPNLSPATGVVHVEATSADTEVRLIRGLRARFPEIPSELTLPELFHSVREGHWSTGSQRILVVIDQFEQWLHNRSSYPDTQLVEALRHCDGQRLQCLLLVRDDFWLATNRFLKALEVELVEGRNARLIDLFDLPHARKVLELYGQGYGRIGEIPNRPQEEFISQAVEELAEDDHVICVRLALFAEMFRGKTWTPSMLRRLGGASGVGVAFLEETFSSKSASPERRLHADAARKVLAALLPDSSVDIRGNMQSRQELLHLSGYAGRPASFDDLVRILDSELRLITPTDPEGFASNIELSPGASRNYWQLTHDFLVAPLRRWLYQKQRETMRGRAELRLDERCATWSRTNESRFLPSFGEYASLRLLTRPASWSAAERKMMLMAGRRHQVRAALVAMALVLSAVLVWQMYGRLRADNLIARLLESETVDIPSVIAEIEPWRGWVHRRLQRVDTDGDSRKAFRVNLALGHLPDHHARIWQRLETGALADEIPVIAGVLQPAPQELDRLWQILREAPGRQSDLARLRAGTALAHWSPDDVRWNDVSAGLALAVLHGDSFSAGQWVRVLKPVHGHLFRAMVHHSLQWKFGDSQWPWDLRLVPSLAASHASESREDLLEYLAFLVEENDFAERVGQSPESDMEQFETMSRRQATAASILAALGQEDAVLPLLDSTRNSRTRALLIEQFRLFGVDPARLFERITMESNADTRAALWLAAGNYIEGALPEGDSRLALARKEFLDHADRQVHSAAEWYLRRAGDADWLDRQMVVLAGTHYSEGFSWRVTKQAVSMVRVSAPGRVVISFQRPAVLDYDFEVSAMEINIDQLLRFDKNFGRIVPDMFFERDPANEDFRHYPATSITWQTAAEFCNWLSESEGISQEQWCYEPARDSAGSIITYPYLRNSDDMRPVLRLVDDYRSRSGFRLPNEAEWEWLAWPACIDQWQTAGFRSLLARYEWTGLNNDGDFDSRPGGMLKPNRFGTFDLFGHAHEMCNDPYLSLFPGDTNTPRIEPGSEYLDPVERRASSGETDSLNSTILTKGVTVIRRTLEDHRNQAQWHASDRLQGFRVVRCLSGNQNGP